MSSWLPFGFPSGAFPFSLPASPLSPAVPLPPTGAPGEDASTELLDGLLEPFTRNVVPLKARTDPTVLQKTVLPMTLMRGWMYLPFFLAQGTGLTLAFLNHHLYGPPKPSWGVELTLFTSFLRQAAAYSHLSSITRLRQVLDLGSLLPPPKDGIVTPISFRVRQRGLRGFLAEADAQEDGKRQISGEWVINKRLWKKMQSQFSNNQEVRKDRVILFLHGGAYYVMSAETHRFLTISVSRYTESRVFAINYRLAPETRFPGQLHDAVSSYLRLILDLKIPPENIVFAGDSAGGGLCLATLMYLRDEGYPLPSGGILMCPWVDLTMSCESWTTNAPFDYLPQPGADDHLNPVQCLLGEEGMKKWLTHPYVSPLFGKFEGLPPLLIQAGEAEVLRDEITLLAHKAALGGVRVEHEVFEDSVHVFMAFLFLESSRRAFQSQRQFVKSLSVPTLPTPLALLTPLNTQLPLFNSPTSDESTLSPIINSPMDAEIIADAHNVDERGVVEASSLPTSPLLGSGALPGSDDESDGERFSDDDVPPIEDAGELDAVEQLEKDEHPADFGPYGLEPTSFSLPGSGTNTPPLSFSPRNSLTRPILRAYVSARDLLMTHSNPASPSKKVANGASRFPLSTPAFGAHSRTSSLATHVESIGEGRAVHARSSSHPDLRALLAEYEEHGPSVRTRRYAAKAKE